MSLEPSYLNRALDEWQARWDELDRHSVRMDAALEELNRGAKLASIAAACSVLSVAFAVASAIILSLAMVGVTVGLLLWSTVVFTKANRTFRNESRIVRALLGMEQK